MDPVRSMSSKEVEHQTGDVGVEVNSDDGLCAFNVFKRGGTRNLRHGNLSEFV